MHVWLIEHGCRAATYCAGAIRGVTGTVERRSLCSGRLPAAMSFASLSRFALRGARQAKRPRLLQTLSEQVTSTILPWR